MPVTLILPQCQQALNAHGKTTGRCWLATELLKQAVIAPTRTDRALRTELIDQIDALTEAAASDAIYYALVDVRTAIARDLEARSADLARLMVDADLKTLQDQLAGNVTVAQ